MRIVFRKSLNKEYDIRYMKNNRKFNYDYMLDFISETLSDRVLRGMQSELNRYFDRNHRVVKNVEFNAKNEFRFKILLPNNKKKIYKVRVSEVKSK